MSCVGTNEGRSENENAKNTLIDMREREKKLIYNLHRVCMYEWRIFILEISEFSYDLFIFCFFFVTVIPNLKSPSSHTGSNCLLVCVLVSIHVFICVHFCTSIEIKLKIKFSFYHNWTIDSSIKLPRKYLAHRQVVSWLNYCFNFVKFILNSKFTKKKYLN